MRKYKNYESMRYEKYVTSNGIKDSLQQNWKVYKQLTEQRLLRKKKTLFNVDYEILKRIKIFENSKILHTYIYIYQIAA